MEKITEVEKTRNVISKEWKIYLIKFKLHVLTQTHIDLFLSKSSITLCFFIVNVVDILFINKLKFITNKTVFTNTAETNFFW